MKIYLKKETHFSFLFTKPLWVRHYTYPLRSSEKLPTRYSIIKQIHRTQFFPRNTRAGALSLLIARLSSRRRSSPRKFRDRERRRLVFSRNCVANFQENRACKVEMWLLDGLNGFAETTCLDRAATHADKNTLAQVCNRRRTYGRERQWSRRCHNDEKGAVY